MLPVRNTCSCGHRSPRQNTRQSREGMVSEKRLFLSHNSHTSRKNVHLFFSFFLFLTLSVTADNKFSPPALSVPRPAYKGKDPCTSPSGFASLTHALPLRDRTLVALMPVLHLLPRVQPPDSNSAISVGMPLYSDFESHICNPD